MIKVKDDWRSNYLDKDKYIATFYLDKYKNKYRNLNFAILAI